MNVQELITKRAKAWQAAKDFLDSHQKENGTLSAEDTATYEKMEAEITDLTAAIERQKRADERDAMMAQPTSDAIKEKPDNGKGEKKTGRASDEYHRDMMTAIRTGFRQVSDYLREGLDSDGGYLVPEELDKRLITVLDEENIMRGLATKITTSGTHKINLAGTRPQAAWIEEGGRIDFSEATFDQKELDAHKLYVAIQVTEELLYDEVFNLEGYITSEFGKALANAEEDAFLNGDGSGKPVGLFHPTKGAEGGITAAQANVLTIASTLKEMNPNAKIVFQTIYNPLEIESPIYNGVDYSSQYKLLSNYINGQIRRINNKINEAGAAEEGTENNVKVADVFAGFTGSGWIYARTLQKDVHPNALGHAFIAAMILDAIGDENVSSGYFNALLGAMTDEQNAAVPADDYAVIEKYLAKTADFIFGDVNGNGKVEATDSLITLIAAGDQMAGNPVKLTESQLKIADVDGDGAVTQKDAQYILMYFGNTNSEIECTWRSLTHNPNAPDYSNLEEQ